MDPNSFQNIKAAVARQTIKSDKFDALKASLSSSNGYLFAEQVAQLVQEFQIDEDKLKAVESCVPRMYAITCEQACLILRVVSRDHLRIRALEMISCRITDDNWPAFDNFLQSSRDLRMRAKKIIEDRPRLVPQTGPPQQPGNYFPGVTPPFGGYPGMAPQHGGYPAPAPYPAQSPYPGTYPSAGPYGGTYPQGQSPYPPPGTGAASPPYHPGTVPPAAGHGQPPYPPCPGAASPQYPPGTVPPGSGQSPYPPYPGAASPQYPPGGVSPVAGQPPYAPPGTGSPTSGFQKIKEAVEKQDFKSEKLITLQSSLACSCEYLSADQVAQLVQEFSLDIDRLQALEICAPKMHHTTCDQAVCILRVFDVEYSKLKALEAIAYHITDNNFAALDRVFKIGRAQARDVLMNRPQPQPGHPPQPGSFPGMVPQVGSFNTPGTYPGRRPFDGMGPHGGMRPPGQFTRAPPRAGVPHDPPGAAPFPSGDPSHEGLHSAMNEMMNAQNAMMKDMRDNMFKMSRAPFGRF